jgi:hypothetical protein
MRRRGRRDGKSQGGRREICHYGSSQIRLRRFGGVGEGFSIIENKGTTHTPKWI